MKEYFKDREQIRYCDANIAKMNAFEFWWLFDKADYFKDVITSLWTGIKDFSRGICLILLGILGIPFSPIMIYIRARGSINRARKEVKKFSKNTESKI